VIRLGHRHRPPVHHLAIGYLFLAGLLANGLLISWSTGENVTVAAQVGSDTTPPDPPVILSPQSGTTFTQTTLTVSGLVEPDSLVKLYQGSGPTFIGSVQSHAVTGSWELLISLPEGTHVLRATATDLSDNTSGYSAPTTVIISLPKPVTLPTFSLDDSYSVRAGELFTLTTSISGGTGPYDYVVRWGDGLTSRGETSGSLSLTHRYAGKGSYNLSVEITDVASATALRGSVVYVSDDGEGPVAAPIVPVEAPRGPGVANLLDLPQTVALLPFWSFIVILIGLFTPGLSALETGRFRQIFIPLISITQGIWYLILFKFLPRGSQFWGVTYDSLTKDVIPRVLVRIRPGGRHLDLARTVTAISDRRGRFGFDVGPGVWQLEVEKAGYRSPSLLVLGDRDGWHDRVEPKGQIVVRKGEAPEANLPVDPEGDRARLRPTKLGQRLRRSWGIFTLIALGVSLVSEQVVLLTGPSPLEIIYFAALALLFLLNIATLVWDHHVIVPVGKVLDHDQKPAEGAVVTLWKGRRALERRVTDAHGHFFFRARRGTYRLSVDADGLQIPNRQIKLLTDGFIAPLLEEGGLTSRELGRARTRRRAA
jgi:hypothetical protein